MNSRPGAKTHGYSLANNFLFCTLLQIKTSRTNSIDVWLPSVYTFDNLGNFRSSLILITPFHSIFWKNNLPQLFYPCPENAGVGQKIVYPHAKKSLVVIVFNIFPVFLFSSIADCGFWVLIAGRPTNRVCLLLLIFCVFAIVAKWMVNE